MPRFPALATRVDAILDGDFGRAPQAAPTGPLARLHIGDSADPPGPEMPAATMLSAAAPGWFRYPAPVGRSDLREALARDYATRHGLPTTSEQILVAPGATAALNTLVHLLCDPCDEVLVPTPAWPLFSGMVRLAGARPVEIPLHHEVDAMTPEEIEARLEAAITARTSMLWLNTPNNPSGTLMDEPQRRAVLAVARRHQLWLISDEAYDGMAFDGRTTPTLAHLEDSPHLCVVSTFSKMYRAAGLRLGWARADPDLIRRATRVATFQNYSASTLAQQLVAPAVGSRAHWSPELRAALQRRRDRFIGATGLELTAPAGTYFLFLDLRRWLGAGFDAAEAVAGLLAAGVCVTAGREFGEAFRGWIRACFATESEAVTERAGQILGDWIRNRASRRS